MTLRGAEGGDGAARLVAGASTRIHRLPEAAGTGPPSSCSSASITGAGRTRPRTDAAGAAAADAGGWTRGACVLRGPGCEADACGVDGAAGRRDRPPARRSAVPAAPSPRFRAPRFASPRPPEALGRPPPFCPPPAASRPEGPPAARTGRSLCSAGAPGRPAPERSRSAPTAPPTDAPAPRAGLSPAVAPAPLRLRGPGPAAFGGAGLTTPPARRSGADPPVCGVADRDARPTARSAPPCPPLRDPPPPRPAPPVFAMPASPCDRAAGPRHPRDCTAAWPRLTVRCWRGLRAWGKL